MATIKKENAIKAWEEGCEDVRAVLENLFPDITFPKFPFKEGDKVLVECTIVGIDEHDSPEIGIDDGDSGDVLWFPKDKVKLLIK